jgi:hypothetical protein
MKLADEIEAMRQRMVEEHEQAMNQLDHLEKRMLAGDAEIMRKIETIAHLQQRNATDIVRHLLKIAHRIGHLPNPRTLDPEPLDGDGARASARPALDRSYDRAGVH